MLNIFPFFAIPEKKQKKNNPMYETKNQQNMDFNFQTIGIKKHYLEVV